MNNYKVSIQTISPRKAAKMLSLPFPNRGTRKGHVADLAKHLKCGEWKFDGAPIRLNKRGEVLDGKHRLLAIIESGITMRVVVVSGLEDDSFKTMDTGKTRTVGDILGIEGYYKPTVTGSIVQQVYCWHTGRGLGTKNAFLRPRDVSVAVKQFKSSHLKDVIETVLVTNKVFKKPGVLGAIGYISGRSYYGKFSRFCDLLATGENLKKGHPVHTLRERILTQSTRSVISLNFLAFATAKAFSCFVSGKELVNLRRGPSEEFPKIPGEKSIVVPWKKMQQQSCAA